MGALALMPGLPFVPFAGFAGLSGWLAWSMSRKAIATANAERLAEATEAATVKIAEEPIAQTPAIDALRIEIGYALLPSINDATRQPRPDAQLPPPPPQLAPDAGFVLAPFRPPAP